MNNPTAFGTTLDREPPQNSWVHNDKGQRFYRQYNGRWASGRGEHALTKWAELVHRYGPFRACLGENCIASIHAEQPKEKAMSTPPTLINSKAAAKRYGVAYSTMGNYRRDYPDTFPKPSRIEKTRTGTSIYMYDVEELDAWMELFRAGELRSERTTPRPPGDDDDGGLVINSEMASRLGIVAPTLSNMRKEYPSFPPARRVGSRVMHDPKKVEAWYADFKAGKFLGTRNAKASNLTDQTRHRKGESKPAPATTIKNVEAATAIVAKIKEEQAAQEALTLSDDEAKLVAESMQELVELRASKASALDEWVAVGELAKFAQRITSTTKGETS